MQKLWVIAGNRHEYNNYITEKDRKGEDIRNLLYLIDADKLYGSSEVHGVFIGTWRNRTDINEIIARIATINGKMPVGFVPDSNEKIIHATSIGTTIGTALPVSNGGVGINKVGELEDIVKELNKIIRDKVGSSMFVK